MPWSHDTCKSADNCSPSFVHITAPPSSTISILFLPSPSSFAQMKKNFRARETRTSSPTLHNGSNGLTLSPQQMQDTMGTGSVSTTEWTDEKHSLYLKSMEASFVNQLYDSKEMIGWCSSKGQRPTTSAQFKVLRGGCWQRINFERNNPRVSWANECCDLKTNPWIQHFRSSGLHRGEAPPALEESATCTSQVPNFGRKKKISSVSTTASGHLHSCESLLRQDEDTFCCDTEMSDQNFIDEEDDGEKENNRSNMKRLKIKDAADNDQIVPRSKSSTTGDVTEGYVSAAENIG